ncbi:flagellar filament capping protein FliD [Ideonella sp. B7]|uniref:flagellar filament capping protein FliD n=1 Tax=Ideonella benzenivorans TaxID=2831643 RepID=UPI001CEDCB10|nr:flagellar filament capping protein FliD [Ideonella benzenivorans]MCA6217988.1 flagellar filament capping protein FliD [Ideonella benzenivorans]
MSSSAPISSLGVGSGLQAESIIAALMSGEQKPIDQLATEQSQMKTQLSSMGKLASLTSTMRDAAASLSSSSLWKTKSFTSADTTVISGSAGISAAAGSYSVSVQALANAQTVTSGTFSASSATLSEGTLTVELGSWSGSTFTGKSGSSPVSITIGPGDTSLASIRDKINGANAGVTASIVNDASGARLSLRSTTTGAENGFRITAAETVDDGNAGTGLSALTYAPSGTASVMSLNQAATNAQATINGIQVSSTSNTFDSVVDGLSFTAGKVSASPVAVTVASDTDTMKKSINSFVSAFNALVSYIKDQTKYTPPTAKGTQGTSSPLQGDATTVGLLNRLRSVINAPSTASASLQHLSDMGISVGGDGTLSVDATKLDTALTKPDEVGKALATDGADSSSSGFMDRFRDLGNAVLDPTAGSLQLRQDAINASIKRNQQRQDELTERLSSYETRLRAQFSALDTQMASMNALSAYVTKQMSALNTSA